MKWVLTLVCVTAVAAVAVGLLSYRLTAAQLESELRGSLDDAASAAAARLTRVRVARRALPPPERGDGIELQVLTGAGRTIDREGSAGIPVTAGDMSVADAMRPGVELYRTALIDDEEHRVLTVSLGGSRGAVQAARSVAESDRVLALLRSRMLVVTVVVMMLGAVGGVLIGGSITRRLLRLVGVAEAVADTGPTGATVPADGTDEVARLGRAFNEMLGALARSEEEQARLTQDAGHELRTPMTSLRTNIYNLRHFGDLDEDARRDVLGDLESQTEELSTLIEDVLAVSAGRLDEEPRVLVDLAAAVRSVAERTAQQWNRRIEVQAPDALAATLRRAQVARAVRNLVDNACKFSPEDSPIEVVLRTRGPRGASRDQGGTIEIEVMDRGPGFEESDLRAVFSRFHRSAAARSVPGSGLGLSIVASVASAHHGDVQASNRTGGGASVVMRLPWDQGQG